MAEVSSVSQEAYGLVPTASSDAPSSTPFPFLSLPEEIQILVFQHLLDDLLHTVNHVDKVSKPSNTTLLNAPNVKTEARVADVSVLGIPREGKTRCCFDCAVNPRFVILDPRAAVARLQAVVALSTSCRALYGALAPILYANPVFHFGTQTTLGRFLDRLTPHTLQAVRRIEYVVEWTFSDDNNGRARGAPAQWHGTLKRQTTQMARMLEKRSSLQLVSLAEFTLIWRPPSFLLGIVTTIDPHSSKLKYSPSMAVAAAKPGTQPPVDMKRMLATLDKESNRALSSIKKRLQAQVFRDWQAEFDILVRWSWFRSDRDYGSSPWVEKVPIKVLRLTFRSPTYRPRQTEALEGYWMDEISLWPNRRSTQSADGDSQLPKVKKRRRRRKG